MAGDASRKALFKALEQAFNSALSNVLPLPLSENISQLIDQFKSENNYDERLDMFLDSSFSDELYQICTRVTAKNKQNQTPFLYIIARLSPFILDFDSLVFWANQCLTNALNSPGLSNELVVISRAVLKNFLTCSHQSMSNPDIKAYEKLSKLRLRNSCYIFKILLNIYLKSDINFYKKGHLVTIRVSNTFDISTQSIINDCSSAQPTEKLQPEDIKVLESYEAKRFINLNIRKLLVEFMLQDAKIGFEILDDYIKDPTYRVDILSLMMNFLNEQDNVMNIEILKSDMNAGVKQLNQSYFKALVNAVSALDEQNRSDINSQDLKEKMISIYNKSHSNTKPKMDIHCLSQTKLFRSLCNCLIFDNDVIIINYALLILITIIPSFVKKLHKLLPLLLIIYARLITWNKNLQLFANFKYPEMQQELSKFYGQIINTSNSTDFHSLKDISKQVIKKIEEQASSNMDNGRDKPSREDRIPNLLTNLALSEWTVVYKNVNGGTFEYKNCSKLYSVLYGLFPNSTFEFLKIPLEFYHKHFGISLKDIIETEHLSFFNDADVLKNSKELTVKHLFNNDLLSCTVEDEINGSEKLRWYKKFDENNASALLWDCLKFDRNISMEFYFPPDNIVNQNILKMFFKDSDENEIATKIATHEQKLDNINDLFKLIDLYKVELYGYETGFKESSSIGSNPVNPAQSPLTLASIPYSNFGSPALYPTEINTSGTAPNRSTSLFSKNYSVSNPKVRKQSIVSSTSESVKESLESGEPSDIMSILNKQSQLFSKSTDDKSVDPKDAGLLLHQKVKISPNLSPSMANSPKFAPLDPDANPPSSSSGKNAGSLGNSDFLNTSQRLPSSSASSAVSVHKEANVATEVQVTAELSKLKREVQQLNESLKYYKRELLLMGNDMEFTNLIRLMTSNEIEQLKKTKFTGFLDNTKSNRLELLKHEDLKSQRDHIHDSFKKMSREYSITLSRKKKNDAINLSKIKQLREENVALTAENSKAERIIEEKSEAIKDFKKLFEEKDSLIVGLQNTIKYLKSQRKVEEVSEKNAEVDNKNEVQYDNLRDTKEEDSNLEHFETEQGLHAKIQVLYEKKEYFKVAERNTKRELKQLKKSLNSKLEEFNSVHEQNLKELELKFLKTIEQNNSEIKKLNYKVNYFRNKLSVKNKEFQALHKELFEYQRYLKPISLRDDLTSIPTYANTFYISGDESHSLMDSKSIYASHAKNADLRTPKLGSASSVSRKSSMIHSHHPLQSLDDVVQNNSSHPVNSSVLGNTHSHMQDIRKRKLDLASTRQSSYTGGHSLNASVSNHATHSNTSFLYNHHHEDSLSPTNTGEYLSPVASDTATEVTDHSVPGSTVESNASVAATVVKSHANKLYLARSDEVTRKNSSIRPSVHLTSDNVVVDSPSHITPIESFSSADGGNGSISGNSNGTGSPSLRELGRRSSKRLNN